ncbi:MAG TPA: DMT family transporter [Rhizobiales bacterium]|nr:DMT family transporter [Hyphomicrobiales bacterium]
MQHDQFVPARQEAKLRAKPEHLHMPQKSTANASVWMLGWFASMLLMTVSGREATQDLPVNMLMFFRSAIGLAILLPIVGWFGFSTLKTQQLKGHAIRSTIHFGAQFSWFMALSLIPLAQVISIEFSMPIWAAVIATFYLGEKISQTRLLAIALGFVGILVIVQPGFAAFEAGQGWALASAFGFAGSVVLTKGLLKRDSAFITLFYMIAVQLLLGSLLAVFFWQWPSAHAWPWVIGAAIAGLTSHYSLARALHLADASFVAQLDFARVPLTVLLGYWLYNEGVDAYLIAGAGLIILGNLINLRRA